MPHRPPMNPSREWVGGRFLAPVHIMEGEPYRPQIALWEELPDVLVVGCKIEDPKFATPFPETLREAMRQPLAGPPRRPRRVRVADPLHAAELRAAIGDLHVELGPTPELQLVAQDLIEHLQGSAPEKDDDSGSYLEGGRVPENVVARLFEAAELLYGVAPWKNAGDEQL